MEGKPGWSGTDGTRQVRWEGLLFHAEKLSSAGSEGNESCSQALIWPHLGFRALWLAAMKRKDLR